MTPVSAPPSPGYPLAPDTLEAAGISRELVTELILKALQTASELSGSELSKRLGLSFHIIEPSLDFLKNQHLCEIVSGPVLGGSSFRFRLTESGHGRAMAALDRNQYSGLAPIPMSQYRSYVKTFGQSVSNVVSPETVRSAFANLVVSDQVLDELGPAINARHSIFIYGPPGNGKSVMAHTIQKLLGGAIAVPQALEVGGQIIRFYDPAIHEPLPWPDEDETFGIRYDRRWILCKRPVVSVGGELTLEALALVYDARSGMYRAPVQTLANGGVLVIDDFGRQQCPPRDLLNWWMVPLESRVEYMTLQSGDKIEMPFEVLIIFSTNINPAELVDEAFLRRIQYKIYAESPTRDAFIEIFKRCCDERHIAFDRQLVINLIDQFYFPRQIELRGCHPRDLIHQALALASYRGQARQLTPELLEAACASYFISEDHEAPPGFA